MIGLLRRRVMGGGGNENPLPPGYTPIQYLSVENGNYYVDTGIVTKLSSTYKFVTKAMFYTVVNTKRQLIGNLYEPWFGCDKGKFSYSGLITPSTPAKSTSFSANTWYDINVSAPSKSNASHRLLVFTVGNQGTSISPNATYQCQMAIKSFYDIYENDVLVRHMIPCKNSNNINGMFDLIDNEFHPLTSY